MENQVKAEAIKFYTQKIDKNPEKTGPYVMRSACFESMENYDAALADALRIIDLKPEFWRGHYLALKCYIQVENLTDARKIVQQYECDEFFKDLLKKFRQLEANILPKVQQSNEVQSRSSRGSSSQGSQMPYRSQTIFSYQTRSQSNAFSKSDPEKHDSENESKSIISRGKDFSKRYL
jgi:tetratricopeptide (TPR) repeat protein